MFSALRLPAFLRVGWQLKEALPFPTLVYIPTGPWTGTAERQSSSSVWFPSRHIPHRAKVGPCLAFEGHGQGERVRKRPVLHFALGVIRCQLR